MKLTKNIQDKIIELYSTGDHTITQICSAVKIDRISFYRWKDKDKLFRESLEACETQRLDGIKDLARSGLAKLLDVFEYEEKTTEYIEDRETGELKVKSVKKVNKFIMPNAISVIFSLTNQDPTNFKHMQHVHHKVDPVKQVFKVNGQEIEV